MTVINTEIIENLNLNIIGIRKATIPTKYIAPPNIWKVAKAPIIIPIDTKKPDKVIS